MKPTLKNPSNDAEVLQNWVKWKRLQKTPFFTGERGYLVTIEDLLTQTLAWRERCLELEKELEATANRPIDLIDAAIEKIRSNKSQKLFDAINRISEAQK